MSICWNILRLIGISCDYKHHSVPGLSIISCLINQIHTSRHKIIARLRDKYCCTETMNCYNRNNIVPQRSFFYINYVYLGHYQTLFT